MQKSKKIVYLENKSNKEKNIKAILIEYLIKKINSEQFLDNLCLLENDGNINQP